MLRLIPLYLTNKAETLPRKQLGPFFTDPNIYNEAPKSGLRVTWMGHSSTLVEMDGMRILIDPVWEQRASPVQWFGPRRFFPAPLQLVDLPRVDVVLISHDHYDHLGAETVKALAGLKATQNARWVTSLGVKPILRRFQVPAGQITELDWTESVTLQSRSSDRSCKFTAWPARHFSGRSAFNRFQTLWSSFVLEGDVHRIYYGADTGWWDGFAEIAGRYDGFDLAMLEIGAFHELWKSIHLGPDGAAKAFRSMQCGGLLMPIHWGLFNLALHAWNEPIERLVSVAAEQRIRLWAPEPGRPTEVVQDTTLLSDWWR